ncbi:hypothetical protein HTIA_2614 [Halorhabdus tiamatea SARL4B]|uniref:Uncharacterized protein n=1 Tax=Halorhabdus tiamatea SARL4B TaxID=1033806 RepID=S6CUV5_9EURY|nr:hypothetical protein HTIA_2614 [Halorhabdus tiamatea SARL4B]
MTIGPSFGGRGLKRVGAGKAVGRPQEAHLVRANEWEA